MADTKPHDAHPHFEEEHNSGKIESFLAAARRALARVDNPHGSE
ncbi:hypothetical protein [Bradyrhizobium sp. NAS96.2]|nr:hypothetical protein [Bradyrhizobium sp. NAS96.2]